MGFDVSSLEKLGINTKKLNETLAKSQFKGEVRARVYVKLATMLRTGVPLTESLEIIKDHASDDGKNPTAAVAVVMDDWLASIKNGQPLGKAVAEWVPEGDRVVIEAGDKAGDLPAALDNALFIAEAGKKIRGAIMGGLAYPILLVSVALGLVMVFGFSIVPQYNDVFPREKWEGGALALAVVADIANYYLLPILVGAGATVAVMIWSLPRWVGPLRVKFDNYPPWSLYRLVRGSGFMLSVSALIKAGVQIPEILRILRKGASPWYDERISGTLRHLNNGTNLGEALYRTGMEFPEKETVRDLRSFAKMGGFEEKLDKMGRDWVENSVDKVKGQMGIVKTMSIIVLAGVFAAIASGSASLNQQMMEQANRDR